MKNKLFFLILFFLAISMLTNAQTKKDAVNAYNTGASIINEDPKAALEQLYRALEISEDLESEGEETKVLAESLIPRGHYNLAMILYKQKKMYETLEQLEKAEEAAKKYFDKNTQGRVERIIPQLYNQMGNTEYRNDNYAKAVEYYIKAIEIKPDYPDPYLNIALSKEKLENYDGMIEYLKKTLEVANMVNDRNKAEDALKKANNFLLSKALEAEKGNEYKKANTYYTQYLAFDSTDTGILFKIGDNNLIAKDFDSAIDFFNQVLSGGNGSIDPALIYFQIGVAYQGKDNKEEACKAFSKALSGQYEANAKYQMEQLKCN